MKPTRPTLPRLTALALAQASQSTRRRNPHLFRDQSPGDEELRRQAEQAPSRPVAARNGYDAQVVRRYFCECRLPDPETEYKFDMSRRWRFDFAWPEMHVALEVDGGIWRHGAHNRGARIKKTWEKENAANIAGWHVYKCEPADLCTAQTVALLRAALHLPV